MITKFGKRFLTNYLAGNSDFATKDIALGIGSTAANLQGNDTRLEFEFYRLPVILGSIDIKDNGSGGFNYFVVYKTTIPQDIAGVISEIGLYPGTRISKNDYDSKFITSFENNATWFDSSGFSPELKNNDSTEPFLSKIGESMVQINVGQSASKEYTNALVRLDLSGYSVNDSLSIAYKKKDENLQKIRVKFYSSDTQYYFVDFIPSSGIGDKIQNVLMGSVFGNTSIPVPDPTNIIKIGVEVIANGSGETTVYFDGIRINDEDTFDPLYGLIARSVLQTPLQKTSGRPVDIEYKLQLGF